MAIRDHRTKIKCRLETAYGEWVERIPAWIKWATQEWNEVQFNGVYYEPPEGQGEPGVLSPDAKYTFKWPRPERCAGAEAQRCRARAGGRPAHCLPDTAKCRWQPEHAAGGKPAAPLADSMLARWRAWIAG